MSSVEKRRRFLLTLNMPYEIAKRMPYKTHKNNTEITEI